MGTFASVNDRHLIFWGGGNQETHSESGYWLYSISHVSWYFIRLKNKFNVNFPLGATFNYVNEKCLIFGDFGSKGEAEPRRSGLVMFSSDIREIEGKI